MKKKLAFILATLMLSALIFTACASGDPNTGGNATPTEGGGAETTTSETQAAFTLEVPDVDMDGKNFNFFSQNWHSYAPLGITDVVAEELNGDLLNDAVYNRNLLVEQKFNCTVTSFHVENPDEGYKTLMNAIMAGDNTYDIAFQRGVNYNKLLLSQGFTQLTDVPYLNFANPWWDSSSVDELAINNRTYVVISDMTMNNYLSIFCIYFNKDMVTDFGMDDPYTLVNDGNWTLDKFYEMSETVQADLDGNDVRDTKDRYGFTYVIDMPEGLLNAVGVRLATLDSDGIPNITGMDEGAISKMQKVYQIFEDMNVSLNCHKRSPQPQTDETGMFMNNQVLFSLGGIYYAPEMRQMESDFGIIPYPKYDTKQEAYNIPFLGATVTYVTVPVTNGDLENTGIFMEYYAYLGYTELLPALYEKLLLGKVARDEDSSAMLDYIFSNSFYDTGMICDFGGMRSTIRSIYFDRKGDIFTSELAKVEEKIQTNINDLIAEMEK